MTAKKKEVNHFAGIEQECEWPTLVDFADECLEDAEYTVDFVAGPGAKLCDNHMQALLKLARALGATLV